MHVGKNKIFFQNKSFPIVATPPACGVDVGLVFRVALVVRFLAFPLFYSIPVPWKVQLLGIAVPIQQA